jgi:hypothetical protein
MIYWIIYTRFNVAWCVVCCRANIGIARMNLGVLLASGYNSRPKSPQIGWSVLESYEPSIFWGYPSFIPTCRSYIISWKLIHESSPKSMKFRGIFSASGLWRERQGSSVAIFRSMSSPRRGIQAILYAPCRKGRSMAQNRMRSGKHMQKCTICSCA